MPGRKYDDAVITDAMDRRERGESWPQIAAATGMTVGAAQYHCLGAGVVASHVKLQPGNRKAVVQRNGQSVRLYTSEDDRRLQELRIGGASFRLCALALGRSKGSIRSRLLTLARLDEMELAA